MRAPQCSHRSRPSSQTLRINSAQRRRFLRKPLEGAPFGPNPEVLDLTLEEGTYKCWLEATVSHPRYQGRAWSPKQVVRVLRPEEKAP
jgi:hypothetical protein